MYSNLQFKSGVNPSDLQKLHPAALIVLGMVALYCRMFKLPCVITSLMDDAPNRKSKTHEEGRAIDFSIKGISPFHQRRLEYQINRWYASQLGTAPEGKPWRVIIIHDAGTGDHIHAQVRVDARLDWMHT